MEIIFSVLNFLLAFSENLDSQLPDNKKHSSRVANISLSIANQLNLSIKEKYDLVISALLHDTGKENHHPQNSEDKLEIKEHALKGSLSISDIPYLEKSATIRRKNTHLKSPFNFCRIYRLLL
ncbi:MAG: HD domain-containing protein [Dictyoglomus sp.]